MATTTSSAVTLRQLFEAVINDEITDKMKEKARTEIAKLDAANAKRAEKSAEKAKENEPIKQEIVNFLRQHGKHTTAEIAEGVGISTSKASAMCRQLVESEMLVASDVSIKNKGKQKAYEIADSETVSE